MISNQARQHPGIIDGKMYDERNGQRPPGLMFFSAKGDEIGGLIFDCDEEKGQGGSLTDENPDGKYFSGIKMNDQNMSLPDLTVKKNEIAKLPSKEAKDAAFQRLRDQGLQITEHVKIGRDNDKASVVKLKDAKGKLRIELKVEADGQSKINFLDDAGKVLFSLPSDLMPHARRYLATERPPFSNALWIRRSGA